MSQPNNKPDQSDKDKEAHGLTQEFNFPKPWIRDYDPAIHGVQSQDKIQRAESSADLSKYLNPQATNQPSQAVNPAPQAARQPFVAPPPSKNVPSGPVQWNPNGVYGGVPEAAKKGIPSWVWIVVAVVVVVLSLAIILLTR